MISGENIAALAWAIPLIALELLAGLLRGVEAALLFLFGRSP